MTPQSTFLILSPVAEGRLDALRELLSGMAARPGYADPENPLVPFGRFDRLPGRHDLVASTRFHRLVRRGREYGAVLSPEDALRHGPDEERGIHFVSLCANLVRQFEFVQNAWIAAAKFDGLFGEGDPLLGDREPLEGGIRTDRFSIPDSSG